MLYMVLLYSVESIFMVLDVLPQSKGIFLKHIFERMGEINNFYK